MPKSDVVYAFVGDLTKSYDEDGYLRVKGLATDATLDLDQQIADPDWLKSAMPKWFEWGNVREMHSSSAVGTATAMAPSGSGYEIEAKIVDPIAAEKIENGVYKGFSIGIKGYKLDKSAEALKKAPGGIINGGEIIEVSVVDRPANPAARLVLAKSVDGELVKTMEVVVDGKIPCPTCGGFGQVKNEGGATEGFHTCPTCEGTGYDVDDFRPTDAGGDKDDGSVGENASEKAGKSECPTCDGTGKIREGHVNCPDCGGDGEKAVEPQIEKREFSDKERSRLADKGHAMPDGSYPIETVGDLKNAIQSFGRAKNPAAVKRHIKKRARELGRADLIPENWKSALADTVVRFATMDKAADDGQWLHDPTTLAAVRDGIVECISAELGELQEGENELWDLSQLLDCLGDFLSWWSHESVEGETSSPFGKDDDVSMLGLGVSPDIIKAAVAQDATDEAKDALRVAVRESLGVTEEFANLTKSAEGLSTEVADLKAQLEDVKKMAAPRSISLRATEVQAAKAAEAEKFEGLAQQARALAEAATDPEARRSFGELAAQHTLKAASLRANDN
ncbi:MAG: hypothetical protein KGH65_04920 [Candidatus Micrarchaeota archaeon]|nr:hypothetical protein [Candidatus Micrarchaeota archaeon]